MVSKGFTERLNAFSPIVVGLLAVGDVSVAQPQVGLAAAHDPGMLESAVIRFASVDVLLVTL
ncbi:MAG TPA: hypothetical protein VH302_08110 [Bryobacteraceae bacterium]|nr:hypothetical protein [Bryobacteraceae bacterium]